VRTLKSAGSGRNKETMFTVHRGTKPLQSIYMHIEAATSNVVTTRQSYIRFTTASQQRP
jgi:hypothetical protein